MVVNKVDENRLRRMAERQGFKLVKSRRRDPLARDYERYVITDADGKPIAGRQWSSDRSGWRCAFDLSEVEEWLLYPKKR
jgi:hypothetical protein